MTTSLMTRDEWCERYAGYDLTEMSADVLGAADWGEAYPLVDQGDCVAGWVDSDGPHRFRPVDVYERPDGTRYTRTQAEDATSEADDDADRLVMPAAAARVV